MNELLIQQSDLMGVDAADPMVALAAILLITAARKVSVKYPKVDGFIRLYAPLLAVLCAVMVRGMMEVIGGHPPVATVDYLRIIGHGVAAGAFAVIGHSQFRELVKKVQTEEEEVESAK